jgi:EAL domain-containing protein (putative c-di-GMP-specific phosphodiesterase class I)
MCRHADRRRRRDSAAGVQSGRPAYSYQPVIELLRSLHGTGIRLSIDDFGTRFSTLSYLNRLPIDALKIDRSFVRGLPTDPGSVALTRAIIVLAQNLGLELIAEGVESPEQAEFLADNGCTRIQGFHLSHAVTSERFAETVRRIEGTAGEPPLLQRP